MIGSSRKVGETHIRSKNESEDIKYEAEFKVGREFGEIGAVIVENEHHRVMYVDEIIIDGLPNGPVKVKCACWVHSKYEDPQKRVFFANKSYLPSETPNGLKRLREEELVSLRGNGMGEHKRFERIYDYDVYNDLGDPDHNLQLKRPVLGGKHLPYPRRCKTGRPRCETDPLSEKRSGQFYVPRDECFSEIKQLTFSAKTVYSLMHCLLPSVESAIIDHDTPFPHIASVDSLFSDGINLPPLKEQGVWNSVLPRLFSAITEGSEDVLRFEAPDTMTRDKFFWFRDEKFARQTLAGLNPHSIRLVTEWPLKSKLDPKIYGPAESAITEEMINREIGGVMTVEQAVKQKKLFILDYHDMYLPYAEKVRELKGTTFYGSRTLFFLNSNDTLRPLAIELTRPPMDGKPQLKQVYAPSWDSTSCWLWRLAKAHVLTHDAGYHQLVSHWLRTHCVTEPYIIATNQQLSIMHPIYRLLHPHFRYTIEINALARESLINADGIIEKSFSPGKYSMELCAGAYDLMWRFDHESLPADLISRGMAEEGPNAPHGLRLTINDYLYANDGLLIWDALKQWISAYVTHYYPNASVVESDKELQQWWNEIRTVGHRACMVIERNGLLSSRHKESNFSKGRFQFRLLQDGNAVLNTINLESNFAYVAYYISDTFDQGNSSNSGLQVRLDRDGSFYVLRRNNQKVELGSADGVPSADYYHIVTLNFDGVLTFSYHPKTFNGSNANWSVIKTIPDNICTTNFGDMGSGTCGFNSICKLKDDKRPECKCPQGYSLSDPNEEYGNCQPDFMQGCEADSQSSPQDLYHLVELQHTDWPTSDYEFIKPCSINDCKAHCLQDCLCIVAVYLGGGCVKKTLPLPYGRQDTQVNSISFLKVRKDEFALKNPPILAGYKKKNQNSLIMLVSVLLGSSVLVNFVVIGVLCMGSFFLYHKKITRNHIHSNKNCIQSSLRYFSYEELEEATNGFEEELGRGSFGIVYKGVMKTDSQDPVGVAVKKLDRVVQDTDKEFRTEVNVIAQTHHRNLVKLLGYCDEDRYRMLVYEYLSNGTLASLLFGDVKPSWNQRTQIAVGIARGLCYLHEECNPQIIHCDIKPQNILLDDYYEARISDFGLSKLLGIDQSFTNTGIRGTKGYVAPEWFKTVPVTVKVDVYSFGVLLLEIICCRRNVSMDVGEEEKVILTDWACDCFSEGALDALVDDDAEALSDKMKLERFVMVSLWCIQEDISLRPIMKKVLLMLEGIITVPAPPSECPLTSYISQT